MGLCNCSMFCCTFLCVNSSFAIISMGRRVLVVFLFVFLVLLDYCVVHPYDAMGLSEVCNCDIS